MSATGFGRLTGPARLSAQPIGARAGHPCSGGCGRSVATPGHRLISSAICASCYRRTVPQARPGFRRILRERSSKRNRRRLAAVLKRAA